MGRLVGCRGTIGRLRLVRGLGDDEEEDRANESPVVREPAHTLKG